MVDEMDLQCTSPRAGKSSRKWPPRLSSRRSAARATSRATVSRLNRRHAIRLERVVLGRRRSRTHARDRRRRTGAVRGSERGRPIATSSRGCRRCPACARWGPPTRRAPAATRDRAVGSAARRRLGHRRPGPRTEDQAFEQRVAGQAVGAVNARASGLARGKQARQRGAPPLVGVDAAHHVVRGRADRNGIAWRCRSRPGAHIAAIVGKRRRTCAASRWASVRNTCPPVSSVSRTMLARHDVTRRKIAVRVVPDHERLAAPR